jgi:hypothetical protein
VPPPASGLRSPASGLRPPVSGLRSPASGLRPQVSGLRSPASGLRPQVSGLRSHASSLRSHQGAELSERWQGETARVFELSALPDVAESGEDKAAGGRQPVRRFSRRNPTARSDATSSRRLSADIWAGSSRCMGVPRPACADASAGRAVAHNFQRFASRCARKPGLRRPRLRPFGGMTVHRTVILFRLTLRSAASALSGGGYSATLRVNSVLLHYLPRGER